MRIAIAGAGIAGLTTALALAQSGRTVTVFERASAFTPVGAGLQLSPNALDVLDHLGVAPRLGAEAVRADAVTLRRGSNGRVIARIPVGSSDGRGYLSLLRADLQDALRSQVRASSRIDLRLGHAVTSIDRSSDWRLRFETGQADERCDLLIAADGVHSRIGAALARPGPTDSGARALRMRVPQSAPAGIEAWLGPGRHAVAYPVAGGRETNLVLIVRDDMTQGSPIRFFAEWDVRLRHLIEAGDTLGSWPLLTRAPRWRDKGLAFVGDAAHAMLPYAAQGAAMAIEDGWMLAVSLARCGDIEAALQDYEMARASRVQRVLERVAFHRMVYHLPRPVSLARDLVLALTPAKRLNHQLDWLYDWRAPPLDSGAS